MEFKIGQVAKMTGFSASGIRFLEEKGIVTPANGRKGEYRSYGIQDVSTLLDCRNYRECGLSLTQILELMRSKDFNAHGLAIETRCLELEQEIREKARLLHFMHQRRLAIGRIPEKDTFCEVSTRPGLLVYPLKDQSSWPEDAQIPYVDSILRFSLAEIQTASPVLTPEWGIGIAEEDVAGQWYSGSYDFTYYPPHKSLHSIIAVQDDLTVERPELAPILPQMENNHCTGMVFSKRILSVQENARVVRYDHFWVDID